jgi:hypothetical protein
VSARLGGTVNVKGGHTAESFQQVLNDYTTGGLEGPVDLKSKVMSKKDIPDVPETAVVRLLNPDLIPLDCQILYTLNETNKYNTHQTKAINRRKPLGGGWVPAEGLTDIITGDPLSEGGDKRTYKTAALFHLGGVVATRIDCPYDGNNDAVMNVDDKYLFTWELIRKYLKELRFLFCLVDSAAVIFVGATAAARSISSACGWLYSRVLRCARTAQCAVGLQSCS